jgi:hypothetical protein
MANRDFEPHHRRKTVIEADQYSFGAYVAIFAVVVVVVMGGFYAFGTFMEPGGSANNPRVVQSGERATVPGAGTTGQAVPGGNWDTRLNKDPTADLSKTR